MNTEAAQGHFDHESNTHNAIFALWSIKIKQLSSYAKTQTL